MTTIRRQIVDNDDRGQEHPQLYREAIAEHNDQGDRKRGVGQNGNRPSRHQRSGRDYQEVDESQEKNECITSDAHIVSDADRACQAACFRGLDVSAHPHP